MINILLANRNNDSFSNMIETFQSRNIQLDQVESGESALSMMADGDYHLMITDEHLTDMSGKTLIEKTTAQDPFMNCVAVSTLSHKDFHEAYEGMGVLMQFPPVPGTEDAQKLLDHLDKIHSLYKK